MSLVIFIAFNPLEKYSAYSNGEIKILFFTGLVVK